MKSNVGPWNDYRCIKPCGVEKISKFEETVVVQVVKEFASIEITHNSFEERKE
jgi:hypothetical protein